VRFFVPTAALIAWLRVSGVSPVLPRRDAFAAASLGVVTAFYTWALLRSFGSIPFALAVLIFYLFPLMAAVIVAGFGWQRFSWKTGAAIVLALGGLALALDVRGGNLNIEGVALAFFAAIGLAVVVVVSSRVFGKGDARPVTLYIAAAAGVLLSILCAASGDFALPQTTSGWIGFVAAATLYGFAMIAFFIAVSMIGPVRASLLSYADAVISAGLGVAVLGQALTLVQIAGIALVIVALIGATWTR
jgi:drug/metabolite transporter (DMT)-like permease